jgi:hypothetical protein
MSKDKKDTSSEPAFSCEKVKEVGTVLVCQTANHAMQYGIQISLAEMQDAVVSLAAFKGQKTPDGFQYSEPTGPLRPILSACMNKSTLPEQVSFFNDAFNEAVQDTLNKFGDEIKSSRKVAAVKKTSKSIGERINE